METRRLDDARLDDSRDWRAEMSNVTASDGDAILQSFEMRRPLKRRSVRANGSRKETVLTTSWRRVEQTAPFDPWAQC